MRLCARCRTGRRFQRGEGAIALVYRVGDSATNIASIDPPIGAIGASVTVRMTSHRSPSVSVPLLRGTVTLSTSEGGNCAVTIATNGLGICVLFVHGAGNVDSQLAEFRSRGGRG